MAARALATLALCACTVPMVPMDRSPILWRADRQHRGAYEKGGVPISGLTCGDQYQLAVAGVPAAEAMIDDCERSTKTFGALMAGFAAVPVVGAGAGYAFDRPDTGWWVLGGLAVAIVTLGVAAAVQHHRDVQLHDAVRIYNDDR